MKKLTKEEYNALSLGGSGSGSKFYDQLVSLKPEEASIITRAEWGTRKYLPTAIARYLEKNHNRKFKINRVADGSGWVFLRVK